MSYLAGLFTGAVLGVLLMAILGVARDADDAAERAFRASLAASAED